MAEDQSFIQRGPKLSKKRWLILTLYILYAAINAFQWFEYSIITNVIMKFYQVSSVAVDWTSIIYMALYMPMVVPASYLMEKMDLRQIALLGTFGTFLGTIIKLFSFETDKMWVIYLGQTILSSMQVFILALPPRIAAVWFGPKEASLACALGVFGTQLGQALGFILPPILVKNHQQVEDIASELKMLHISVAAFSAIVLLAVLSSFSAKPALTSSGEEKRFLETWRNLLMRNRGFVFLALAYGINVAVFVSVSTLLNQLMLAYFEKSEEDAGRIGLIMVIMGMIGAVAFGYVLDKTHAYKKTAFFIYVLSLLSVVAFMYALESRQIVFVYLSASSVGLFINAYMPVGLELAIELTYPEPESTSSGILISMTQSLGVVFTLLLGYFFPKFGTFGALSSMTLFLLFGTVLTALIPNVEKRQLAFKRRNKNVGILCLFSWRLLVESNFLPNKNRQPSVRYRSLYMANTNKQLYAFLSYSLAKDVIVKLGVSGMNFIIPFHCATVSIVCIVKLVFKKNCLVSSDG